MPIPASNLVSGLFSTNMLPPAGIAAAMTSVNGSHDVAEKGSRGGDGAGTFSKAAAAVAQTATEAFESVKQTAAGAGVTSGNRPAGTGGDPRKQVGDRALRIPGVRFPGR